jgi:ABC-type lipoprotein export system ATPase subunit
MLVMLFWYLFRQRSFMASKGKAKQESVSQEQMLQLMQNMMGTMQNLSQKVENIEKEKDKSRSVRSEEAEKSLVVKAEHLRKTYKDGDREVVALEDVSFKLYAGENMAIVGPSGSGKSTLLQLIGGLSTPSSGTTWIDGQEVGKGTDYEISRFRNRTIGFVFQMIYLQDYFTAAENVMLPLMTANVDRREALERAHGLLKRVGIEHRANHKPKQMSGGEMQRVAVARALANNPKIILADEPTGSLDKENADNVMNLLDEISRDGVSVIVITHDQAIAARYPKILKLEHGKMVDIQQ